MHGAFESCFDGEKLLRLPAAKAVDINVTDSNHFERKFFMHAAHKAIGVSAGPAALRSRLSIEKNRAENSAPPLRLGMIGFAVNAQADWAFEVLWTQLKQFGPATCDRLLPIADDDQWDDAYWQSLDCVLLGDWPNMDRTNAEAIRRFCRRGGGVVGLNVNGPTSDERAAFDRDVLGRSLSPTNGALPMPTGVIAASGAHPVLANAEPFVANVVPLAKSQVADDAVTLLNGLSAGRLEPIAWVRRYCGGRVFATGLGNIEDFQEPQFLRLLGTAVRWTAGQRTP